MPHQCNREEDRCFLMFCASSPNGKRGLSYQHVLCFYNYGSSVPVNHYKSFGTLWCTSKRVGKKYPYVDSVEPMWSVVQAWPIHAVCLTSVHGENLYVRLCVLACPVVIRKFRNPLIQIFYYSVSVHVRVCVCVWTQEWPEPQKCEILTKRLVFHLATGNLELHILFK